MSHQSIVRGRNTEHPDSSTIAALIEKSIVTTPDAPAIRSSMGDLTFGKLGEQSALLGSQLSDQVGCRDLLPILSEGGTNYILAVVACVRYSIPFVPLDRCWPAARLKEVLPTLPPIVLDTGGEGDDAAMAGIDFLSMDQLKAKRLSQVMPVHQSAPESLAYGFFTSGSTGTPKCALNIHRGLANRIEWMRSVFGDNRVVMQNSRHVFDSSLWQIFLPLCSSGAVVLPDRQGPLDIRGTITSINRWSVEMLDFVPSVFDMLVHHLENTPSDVRHLSSLKDILVGGEAINGGTIERFQRLAPTIRVRNTYGPTEASIGSVTHPIPSGHAGIVPLGQPIDNTFVAVVGQDNTIVPRDEVGEIVIGGICLGSGYRGDEEKTTRAFTELEVEGRQESVYRMGDLGRIDQSGQLWFLGRKDNQIKIGGVRIEPGEIEHHLRSYPGLRSAAVVTVNSRYGVPILVAVYVSDRNETVDVLRMHLANLVPRDSIPSRFIQMNELPMNHNGKLDRIRIRASVKRTINGPMKELSQVGKMASTLNFEAADGTTLKIILSTLQKQLPGTDVTPTSTLTEIGVDSLSAVHLSFELERALDGVELDVGTLFRHPTPEALANWIDSCSSSEILERTQVQVLEDVTRVATGPALSWGAELPQEILLTGSTGFVGTYLLSEILRTTEITVHCLIRGSEAEGCQRLTQAFQRHDLPPMEFMNRINIVPGDVSLPLFGLSSSAWSSLTDTTDLVVHLAADVNFLKNYEDLRAVNVGGLTTALAFAAEGRSKRLVYTSSTSAFGCGDDVIIPETSLSDTWPAPESGYNLTKWVNEVGLFQRLNRGDDIMVVRLGEAMPEPGRPINPLSAIAVLVDAVKQLGAIPAWPKRFDLIRSDHLAKIMSSAIGKRHSWRPVLNFTNPDHTSLSAMVRSTTWGRDLAEVTISEFIRSLRDRLSADPTQIGLARALALIESEGFNPTNDPYCVNDAASEVLALNGLCWTLPTEFGLRE